MTRIFVYGTLKRGRCNHHWLQGQRFVAEARTKPIYRLYDMGGYPGMVRDDNGVAVEGEIWEVDAGGLARLDVLEDIEGCEYERVMLELERDHVEGYLFLQDVSGRPDAGPCW